MNEKIKHIIIALGIFAGLGVTGLLIYHFAIKPKREKKEEEERQKRLEEQKISGNTTLNNPSNTGYKFNVEGELDYPSTELMGKTLYPKPIILGGEGYAWLRSSALVDNGGWDFWSNQIKKVHDEKKIGKVIDYTKGDETGYAYTWFKVKIDGGIGVSETYGWVRSDAVIFK